MTPPSLNLGSTGDRPGRSGAPISRDADGRESHQFGAGSNTRVFAVSSGKGGVGKSTVAVNLAVASAQAGKRVGILDADVHGFSVPALLGLAPDGRTPSAQQVDGRIAPLEAHGVSVISMAMFLGDVDARLTAVSWRGPLLHRTLLQFLRDAAFPELDELFIDLPPGSGDIAMSLGQLLPHAEVLVVTTPQTTATDVAIRSGLVAAQSGQRVLGVIETFSGALSGVEGESALFGVGGGELVATRLSAQLEVPVANLGSIPLSPAVPLSGERGVPLVVDAPDDRASVAMRAVYQQLTH